MAPGARGAAGGTVSAGGDGATAGPSGGSGLSVADRATTAGVCVDVSGADTTAVSVGVKLPAQAVIPAQAQAQLQPVLAKVSTVAA